MKTRTDFVTNSSSTSFIISRKGPLTEAQKEAVLRFVEETFLKGDEIITKGNFKEFCESHYIDEDDTGAIKRELEEGREVHYGTLGLAAVLAGGLYQKCWKVIEQADPSTFHGISTEFFD